MGRRVFGVEQVVRAFVSILMHFRLMLLLPLWQAYPNDVSGFQCSLQVLTMSWQGLVQECQRLGCMTDPFEAVRRLALAEVLSS